MDADAFAFHAAEPGHLPFGKLVDCGCQLASHLIVCEFAYQVLCHEFVLQSVVDQILCADRFGVRGVLVLINGMGIVQSRMRAIQQAADFIYHSFFKTGIQAGVDFGVANIARNQSANVICLFRQEGGSLYRVFCFVNSYFECADQALAGVVVSAVMKRL